MPLLTVRLTDDEHRDLKALAEGSSMAQLVKGWIARAYASVDTPVDTSTPRRELSGLTLNTLPNPPRPRPSYVAAPDDDCMACHHDRQSYHLNGVCTAAVTYRGRCGCPAFVDPAEPF